MAIGGTRGAVVVTGASSGIGAACALHLDRLGFRVFAGIRKPADAEALRRQASDHLTPLSIDVADGLSVAAAAAAVAERVGAAGLGGLVNNAGIVVAGPLELLPIAEVRRQFEVNVIGQVAATQAFLPLLRRARGRIVNIGSISGRMATPFLGPYSASKFAMEALTDALRVEVQPWGIKVAIVEPGAIKTPLWDKSQAAGAALLKAAPAEGRDLYARAIEALQKAATRSEHAAIPADAVAQAVARALTARRPKTRYLVGRDARIQAAIVKLVPDKLRDHLIAKAMRLPADTL